MTVPTALDLRLRWLIARDLPEVVAIEDASSRRPWSAEDFRRRLRLRNCLGYVAECPASGRVVGSMVYELLEGRIYLMLLTAHPARPDAREALLGKLLGKLPAHRRPRVAVDVAERALAAQLYWRARGFRAVAVVRGGFGVQDAYRFEYALPEGAAPF